MIVALGLLLGSLAVGSPDTAEADPPVGEWTVLSPLEPVRPPNASDGSFFTDVSCPTTDFCMAVGGGGSASFYAGEAVIEVWDGASWTQLPFEGVPDDPPDWVWHYWVQSVSCWSETDCALVVGQSCCGDIYSQLWFWDGTTFVHAPSPCCLDPETDWAVDCAADGTCVVKDLDFEGYTIWEDGVWVYGTSTVDETSEAMACGSAQLCVLPGWDYTHIYDGTDGEDEAAPGPGFGAWSVDCTSDTFCMAVSGSAATWDGSGWTDAVRAPDQLPRTVSCVSASHCVALSAYPESHPPTTPFPAPSNRSSVWDGSAWSGGPDAPGDDDTRYNSISCAGGMCMAVGWDGPPGSRELVAARFDIGAAPLAVGVGDVVVTETLQRGWWVPAVFPLTLSEPATTDVTVEFETHAGSATSGPDFETASGQVTIPAGQRHGSATVWVKGDGFYEGSNGYATPGAEDFAVELTGTSGGAIVGRSSGTGTIRDSVPGLVVGDLTVVEGDGGSVRGWLTVSLEQPADSSVQVDYSTFEHGAAASGVDFLPRSGTVTIPAGKSYTRIQVWARGDSTPEATETFGVLVTGASGAEITDGLGVIGIAADE